LDLNTLEIDTPQDLWLPLTGRTDDEKVTGDVNIVVTKGPLSEVFIYLFPSLYFNFIYFVCSIIILFTFYIQ
jgi:hypothetical protein